jgi:hypothetical protein
VPSDEITSIVKGTIVPSTFPKERGGERAYSARRGFRGVVWYVFLEIPFLNIESILKDVQVL